MADQVPSVGRIVHYVMSDGRYPGEHRPAIIVKVWEEENPDSLVQLQVFTDGPNDYLIDVPGHNGVAWRTSVHHDETKKKQATWHWPEYVPAKG
ncbi:MAG: hypothetical protein AUF65_01150 [Chloroflexi bacterium 13_1_20CM_50_12]|nr:MAG: hypothetical protein AUF65_01150 [Chloroflexi bacterium 13_1_20CM_50_12]